MSMPLPTQATDTGRERGTHPAHVGHLVMGLAFLGLVGIWGAVQSGAVDTDNVRWLLPLPWVVAGAAGLIAAVFSGRRARRPVPAAAAVPAYEPEPETAYDEPEPEPAYDEPTSEEDDPR